MHPIWNIELAVLEANVPTHGVHWGWHGGCNPRQPAKSLSREASTELQLRRSCESWSDIRFARPPGRSETCENHRETINIIRTRTENEHKHQHLPKSQGNDQKCPRPFARRSERASFFPPQHVAESRQCELARQAAAMARDRANGRDRRPPRRCATA